jgi:very-short-patch-repair endonuclease
MRAPVSTFKPARTLRRQMSLPEVVVWQLLRSRRLKELRFRRQHPIGPYVLDFYCPSARLAVEIDGMSHDFAGRAVRDARRDAWLNDRDVRVLRVEAKDVLDEGGLEGVLSAIISAASTPSTAFGGPPPPQGGGGS